MKGMISDLARTHGSTKKSHKDEKKEEGIETVSTWRLTDSVPGENAEK